MVFDACFDFASPACGVRPGLREHQVPRSHWQRVPAVRPVQAGSYIAPVLRCRCPSPRALLRSHSLLNVVCAGQAAQPPRLTADGVRHADRQRAAGTSLSCGAPALRGHVCQPTLWLCLTGGRRYQAHPHGEQGAADSGPGSPQGAAQSPHVDGPAAAQHPQARSGEPARLPVRPTLHVLLMLVLIKHALRWGDRSWLQFPRYARVNTLVSTVEEAVRPGCASQQWVAA